MQSQIKIRELSAGYNGKIIIENINIDINKNDFVGIIGPNGGGKTTFLKVILGFLKPMKGSIIIKNSSPKEMRKIIGYVAQTNEYDRKFPITVYDIVLMARLKYKSIYNQFYNKKDKEIVLEKMVDLDIKHLAHKHISTLSGGERKRVYIARALVTNPEILLLDEPTSDIDKKIEKEFYDLLKKINKNITILLVSHDIGIVSSYVKSIACINKNLHYHNSNQITREMIQMTYDFPFDVVLHGLSGCFLENHKVK